MGKISIAQPVTVGFEVIQDRLLDESQTHCGFGVCRDEIPACPHILAPSS